MPKPETDSLFKRVIKDPLFHFLILGGFLFLIAPYFGGSPANSKNEIVITLAGQQHLADLFELTWQRKPTPDELSNLIEEHIKEEVYYREALALGLDDNDTIVRRRLRQKLEFMQEDLSSLVTPTEVELKAFFNDRIDQYKTDSILSFTQTLVSTKRLEADNENIGNVLGQLSSGIKASAISRSSLLPISMKLETEKAIANTFGNDFFAQVTELKTGEWSGPVYSGFGTHLVNVHLNQEAKPQGFEASRTKVLVDYTQALRDASAANYYKNLRNQYLIKIADTLE